MEYTHKINSNNTQSHNLQFVQVLNKRKRKKPNTDISRKLIMTMRAEPTITEKLLSLREKEIKELRIERAEHIRKIEQLEEQNEDFLLELASLKMTMPSSGGGGGGGGGDTTFGRWNSAVSSISGASGVDGDTGRWSNAASNKNNLRRGEQEEDRGGRRRSNCNQRNIGSKRRSSRNVISNGRQDTMISSSSGDYGYGDTEDIVPTTMKSSNSTARRVSHGIRRPSRRGSRRPSIIVRRDDDYNQDESSVYSATSRCSSSNGDNSKVEKKKKKKQHKKKKCIELPF